MIPIKKFWVLPLIAGTLISMGVDDYKGTTEGIIHLISGGILTIATLIYFFRVIVVGKMKKKEMSTALENGFIFLAIFVWIAGGLYTKYFG